jgi:hypothetical protein
MLHQVEGEAVLEEASDPLLSTGGGDDEVGLALFEVFERDSFGVVVKDDLGVPRFGTDLGIPLGVGTESPAEAARKIGIDEISLVTEELFFPLVPIYISSCVKISGVSKRNYQERQKFFNQQLEQSRQVSESNENFELVLKNYEASCHSRNAEDCWIITYKAALMNRTEDSLKFLESALSQGWNNWKHLESDKDIENIRNLDRFKVLVKKYKK